MIRPKSLRQLAAYSISLPAFAVSPKLAKETVYMPSHVAAEMLGRATVRPETTTDAPANPDSSPVRRVG